MRSALRSIATVPAPMRSSMSPQHASSAKAVAGSFKPARAIARESTKKPVLLLDVMDTVVTDPFYKHMPSFFDMTFEELLAAKHPSAWMDFEKGLISQSQFYDTFFKDGRKFDCTGLETHMADKFAIIPGMEELLSKLHAGGYEMHTMSNYPCWFKLVEEKCQLSRYMSWTFVSCEGPMQGMRKPDPSCYDCAVNELKVEPQDLVFVDDRLANVEAAREAGLNGVHFTSAEQLREELEKLGVDC